MSSNPQPDPVGRDAILGFQEWKSDSQDHGKEEHNPALEVAPPESNRNELNYANDQSDTDSSNEYFDAREYISGDELSDSDSFDEQSDLSENFTNDSHVEQDPEEMSEIISNLDIEYSEQSEDGHIFNNAEVEHIRDCFKYVVLECCSNNSSKDLSMRSSEVLNRSFDLATNMAQGDEVQQAVLRRARANPSFMRHIGEFGEDIDIFKTPPIRKRWRRRFKKSKNNNEGDSSKLPWYIRFLHALWKLCHQLYKLGARAINVVVNKIMACFNVARSIAQSIFKAIQHSLLWLKRAITDPQGEIKKILDDPEKSNPAKALGVIGVVATAIVGALLLACGLAEVGPYGAGAAAIGASASAMLRRQAPPDQEEPSIGNKMKRRTQSLN